MAEIPWTLIGIIVAIVASIVFICCCFCCIWKACCREQNTQTQRRADNKGRTSNTLDLHGDSVKSAQSRVKSFLDQHKQGGTTKTLSIITGKGNHSHDGPVLKHTVPKYLRQNGYKCKVDPKNTGRLIVDKNYYDIV